jgi:hypothetical protein
MMMVMIEEGIMDGRSGITGRHTRSPSMPPPVTSLSSASSSALSLPSVRTTHRGSLTSLNSASLLPAVNTGTSSGAISGPTTPSNAAISSLPAGLCNKRGSFKLLRQPSNPNGDNANNDSNTNSNHAVLPPVSSSTSTTSSTNTSPAILAMVSPTSTVASSLPLQRTSSTSTTTGEPLSLDHDDNEATNVSSFRMTKLHRISDDDETGYVCTACSTVFQLVN